MTSRAPQSRDEVGIRELHDQLSRYVRRAAEGNEVIVTMRGRPIARLTPMEAPPRLRETGPTQETPRPRTPVTRRIRLKGPGPLMSDYVADQRR
jgi:prevent-host-death family protein